MQNVARRDGWGPGLLTCFPHTAEAVLSGVARDFFGDAQLPQADLALVALQSVAWSRAGGKEGGRGSGTEQRILMKCCCDWSAGDGKRSSDASRHCVH